MTTIEISDRIDSRVEARILRGISSYVSLRIRTEPHSHTVVSINLTAEEAEALGCKLLSAATAINGRPPLDKSTALDAGAAAV